MPATTAALELKVLINILQTGAGLQSILNQVAQVSRALTQLQTQANTVGVGVGTGGVGPLVPPPITPFPPVNPLLNQIPPAAGQANDSLKVIENTVNRIISAVRFLAGGFLALQSVQFIKGLADQAAQVQVLTTTLQVVAANAGYTADKITEVDKSVQKLGITAASSKQSLTTFLQANLPLQYAPQLARAAQDLAVISGMNSSDTFRRLIVNIQQLDTLGLRLMGVVVDRAAAEEKFKEKIGQTTRELNKRQQQEALLLEVLERSKLLEGAYSTAMGDVAKQITSLSRLTETYRGELGNSLLPAYSAVVTVIDTTLQKLIVLSREFSANGERAEAWANIARNLAQGVSELVLFIARHLEQLVQLAKWYIELRVALFALNTAARGWSWVIGVIDMLTRLRLAINLLMTGQITLATAIAMVQAASAKAAVSIGMQATAQAAAASTATQLILPLGGVTTAATTATTAVTGLSAAVTGFAALAAVPIVFYVIYRIKKAADEESAKPFLQRAQEAQEELKTVFGEEADIQRQRLDQAFLEWRRQIGETKKSNDELWKDFFAEVDKFKAKKVGNEIKDELAKAREEFERLRVEKAFLLEEQRKALKGTPEERVTSIAPDPREIEIAEERVKEAGDRVRALQEQLKKTAADSVKGLALSTQEITAQIDKVAELEEEYKRLRRTGSGASAAQIAEAKAAADIAKEQRDAMISLHEERLKQEVQGEDLAARERRRREQGMVLEKAQTQQTIRQAELVREAIQNIFGDALGFGPEGVGGGQFGKISGGLQDLMEVARDSVIRGIPISRQLQDEISEAVTKAGQAATKPLDLRNLIKLQPSLKELGIEGLDARTRQSIALAELNVRQASLATNAPLVAEQKKQIQLRSQERIQAAEKELNSIKAAGATEGAILQSQFNQQIIGLDQYHRERLQRIEREGAAEAAVQTERIKQAQALADVRGQDPRDRATALQQVVEATERRRTIAIQTEQQIQELIIQTQERRRTVEEQISVGLLQIAAARGGEREALELANFQLNKELNTIMAIGTAEADALIRQRAMISNYETLARIRQQDLQRELDIQQTQREQLALQQQQQTLASAKIDREVALGEITNVEAIQKRNALVQQEIVTTTEKRISLAQTLATQQAAFIQQENDLRRKQLALIEAKTLSEENATKEMEELQRRNAAALNQTEQAIVETDIALVNLDTRMFTFAQQLKSHFIDTFANALTTSIVDFRKAGESWIQAANDITRQIVSIFTKAFTEALFKRLGIFSLADRAVNALFGLKGGSRIPVGAPGFEYFAEGGPVGARQTGLVRGPGTGTSDSIPAMVSAGEHIMPAEKARDWLPLLEGIRLGSISTKVLERIKTGDFQKFAQGGIVQPMQSIAAEPIIPRMYAGGGVVIADGGASAVQMPKGPNSMVVSLHPDALNMTMRDWLELEVVRQQGRR